MRMENSPMDAEERQSVWTSEKFLELRKQFLEAQNEVTAFDVLQRLVAMNPDDVDENAWLDCKDLIVLLLETIPVDVMLLRQQVMLLQAVDHSPPHVVSTLAHFYANKSEAYALLRRDAVAVSVAFARRINDTQTFEEVAKLLAPVVSEPEVKGELIHQLETSRPGDEHRFRVYQVLLESVRRHSFNDDLLPLMQFLVSDLNYSKDVLNQLSVLDFLADFAIANKEATELLARAGLIDQVHSLLSASKESPDGGFLFSACVKFFGCLAHCYPEVIDRYDYFVPIVTNMMLNYNSLDASQRLLAVETFAHLAYTAEAKNKLHEKAEAIGLPGVLFEFCHAARTGPVELRVRVIEALLVLFEQGNEEILSIWLRQMGGLPEILTAYVVKPFPTIRQAAIRLVGLLLGQKYGVEALLSAHKEIEQFKEWLVDPQSESEWECAQVKNDLVRAFLSADWPFVDASLKDRLKPYFDAPKKAPEVATMEL